MKRIELVLIIGVAISIAIGIFAYSAKTRVAYVRTGELLDKYEGMKEAVHKYDSQVAYWQSKLDSIQREIHFQISNYNADSLKYTKKEKVAKRENIRAMQFEYQQLNYEFDEKAKIADEKIMTAILNQVNSFIYEYGERNSYDIIFGTLETGNVIYGKEKLDITEEVIYELNKTYLGE